MASGSKQQTRAPTQGTWCIAEYNRRIPLSCWIGKQRWLYYPRFYIRLSRTPTISSGAGVTQLAYLQCVSVSRAWWFKSFSITRVWQYGIRMCFIRFHQVGKYCLCRHSTDSQGSGRRWCRSVRLLLVITDTWQIQYTTWVISLGRVGGLGVVLLPVACCSPGRATTFKIALGDNTHQRSCAHSASNDLYTICLQNY